MKQSYLIILLVCLLTAVSCKEEQAEPTDIIPLPACKLIKSTSKAGLVQLYDYDDKERLFRYTSPMATNMKWEYGTDNQLTKIIHYRENDELLLNRTELVEYNQQGQWTKISYTDMGGGSKVENVSEYDSFGNRTKITYKSDGKIVSTRNYEYKDGNLMKESYDTYWVYAYEYDTSKENKLKEFEALASSTAFASYTSLLPTPSKNMVSKKMRLDSDGTIATTANYSYEYNVEGFPTKLTISGGDLNEDGQVNNDDIYGFSYEYECKK